MLLSVCFIVLLAPALSGFVARREISELSAQTAEMRWPMRLELLEWSGGWLSSTARMRLHFDKAPRPHGPFDVTLIHGPVSIGELAHLRSPRLALAVLRFEASSDDMPPAVLAQLAGAPLLVLDGQVELDGDLRAELRTKPVHVDGQLTFEGVGGELSYDAGTGQADAAFRVGAISIPTVPLDAAAGPPVRAAVEGWTIEAAGRFPRDDEASASLDHLAAHVGGFAIGDALVAGARLLYDVEEADGQVNVAVDAGFERLSIPRQSAGPFSMRLTLSGVDAERFEAFRRSFVVSDDLAMKAVAQGRLLELLQAGLRLELEQLELALPQGPVRGKVVIDAPEGLSPVALQTGKVSMAMTFDLPAYTVHKYVEDWLGLQVGVTRASEAWKRFQVPLTGARTRVVETLLAHALMVRDGDMYRIDAAFDRAGPTAHGQPLNLPALMREIGAATTELARR